MRPFRFYIFIYILFLTSCQDESPFAEPIDYTGPKITFAAIGDFGDHNGYVSQVSELVKSFDPEFIITLGDNNYPDGELSTIQKNLGDHYCDFIFNPDAPDSLRCNGLAAQNQENAFFPSLGNHDYDNPLLDQPYTTYFTLPGDEKHYDFVKGPIHFFVLNSNTNINGDFYTPNQEDWLLEKSRSSTAPFKVVYFHHSPFSSSKHGSITNMHFDYFAADIDLVMAGHNHTYEKITPKIEDEVHYIVNGLGGRASIDVCDTIPIDTDRFESFCYNNFYGALKGEATGDSLILQFYSLSNQDNLVDELVLLKN